ncbi:MAG: hypothetical protein ABIG69_04085 [Bacteroidota bacterium]
MKSKVICFNCNKEVRHYWGFDTEKSEPILYINPDCLCKPEQPKTLEYSNDPPKKVPENSGWLNPETGQTYVFINGEWIEIK